MQDVGCDKQGEDGADDRRNEIFPKRAVLRRRGLTRFRGFFAVLEPVQWMYPFKESGL